MTQERSPVYQHFPDLARIRDEVIYADIWEKPDLVKRDRSLVTVAALVALNRTGQLRTHIGRALDNGVTREEIRALITHLAFYAGWPCALDAAQAATEVFEAADRA